MRQQINLYQPIFSEERKLFSAATVAMGIGIVAVALVAFTVHAQWRVGHLAQQVETLRGEQSHQEAMLSKAGELQAAQSSPAEIEVRIKQLTASVAERTNALQVLQSGAAGQTTGFAGRLEALARRHVEGLWIDSMVLSGTNGSMSLSGATLNPDIVPTYLRSLAHEPVLSGTRFDDFVIERPEAGKQDDSDAEPEGKRKKVEDKHIRFRAGSKALVATSQEAAT